MADLELHVHGNVIDQEDLYKFDKEALDLVLEEEAKESRAHEEWLEKCRQQEEEDAKHERRLFVEAAFALEVDAMGALDLVEVEAVGALDVVKVEALGALDHVEVGAVRSSSPSSSLEIQTTSASIASLAFFAFLAFYYPPLLSLLSLLIQPLLLSLPP
uniref:Uncharacterized protein n=1 Tax=Tanacetum cinerariifolium TaxID=118510 RepID=A0A699HNF4_TANCI|nr:hypothetical protein [Tanacetum cinerariifolium]